VRCTIGSIFKKLPETYAPSIKRVSDDFVRTGDEGFYVKDADGQTHIFIVGRINDVIERQGERISPGRITNIVSSLKEVESVVVLGFPNRHVGYEVGAYVIPIPAAQIGEKALRQKLLQKLDWEDCPKVIIFGNREKGGLPDKDELIKQFDRFYEINYVSEP
jgi:acyl-CoA synthetase (AMP-forming)/AMP-acid ligase II